MDQLKGTLRFVSLSTLTQLLVRTGSTGRLHIARGMWLGEIALRDGQLVAARLGSENGRAALEGMVLALDDAEFVFLEQPVEHAGEPLLSGEELARSMAGLDAERNRLQPLSNALGQVPRLVEHSSTGSQTDQVTIEAAALRLVPALVSGRTLEQIAQQWGLAATLRQVGLLQAAGLFQLDPAPPPPASALPAAARPLVENVGPLCDLPAPRRSRRWRDSLIGFFIAEPVQQT